MKSNSETKEAECRKKRGHKERSIHERIEKEIFVKYHVKFSSYHGGDMEGPSIRGLMANGDDLFHDIAELVKVNKSNEDVTNEEIDELCGSFGRMALLLDGIFSKVNTKRGEVTDDLIAQLEKQLELARLEWDRLGFSQTPKWHLLLDHIVWLMKVTGGFVDMGEDVVERFHQYRCRDEAQLIWLRNQTIIKNAQAKFQNTRMIPSIIEWRGKVTAKFTRKRKREGPTLGKERKAVKKMEQEIKRDGAIESVSQQTDTISMVAPREKLMEELKKKEEKNKQVGSSNQH